MANDDLGFCRLRDEPGLLAYSGRRGKVHNSPEKTVRLSTLAFQCWRLNAALSMPGILRSTLAPRLTSLERADSLRLESWPPFSKGQEVPRLAGPFTHFLHTNFQKCGSLGCFMTDLPWRTLDDLSARLLPASWPLHQRSQPCVPCSLNLLLDFELWKPCFLWPFPGDTACCFLSHTQNTSGLKVRVLTPRVAFKSCCSLLDL